MSLLGDVRAVLENSPNLVFVGTDERDVHGSFNTHVLLVAPSYELGEGDLRTLLHSIQTWIPHDAHRLCDFTNKVFPYGVLIYRETIGKEKVFRTFSVDDATNPWGKEFARGPHAPVEQELVRTIEVTLYPTEGEARRHVSNEAPNSAVA